MLCIEYLLIVIISIIISYTLLSIFIQLLPHGSIIIQSKDMQAALMTDILPLILYVEKYNLRVILILYINYRCCVHQHTKIKKEKSDFTIKWKIT